MKQAIDSTKIRKKSENYDEYDIKAIESNAPYAPPDRNIIPKDRPKGSTDARYKKIESPFANQKAENEDLEAKKNNAMKEKGSPIDPSNKARLLPPFSELSKERPAQLEVESIDSVEEEMEAGVLEREQEPAQVPKQDLSLMNSKDFKLSVFFGLLSSAL